MKRNKSIRVWLSEDVNDILLVISQLRGTSISSTVYKYIIDSLRREDIEELCVVEKELLDELKSAILKLDLEEC